MKKLLLPVLAMVMGSLNPPALANPPAASLPLRIYAWSEYIPDWLVEEFSKETGVVVELRTYASNEELLTRRLDSGQFDLIQPSDYVVERLIARNQLEAIDRARIVNWQHLDPAFTSLPHDPQGRFSVPWMAGTVGILVDTRRVTEPIRGCLDLFSGSHAGRIATIDDSRQLVSLALASLAEPANEVTDASLARVAPVLENWMRQVVHFDSDTAGSSLVTGDADAALVWSGEAAALLDQNPAFKYIFPSEGTFGFLDCLCIPKGARNKSAAEDFINFVLRPDVSVRVSADYPYTNPNAAAVRLLTAGQRGNPASYPPEGVKIQSLRDLGAISAALDLLYAKLKEKAFKND